jgi:hypothetical protein
MDSAHILLSPGETGRDCQGLPGIERDCQGPKLLGLLGKTLILLGAASPFHAGDRGSNPLGEATH